MADWKGIRYSWATPEDGSSGFAGRFSNDGSRVEASFFVRHPTRVDDVVLHFTGYPVVTGSAPAYISRQVPHFLDDFRDINNNPWLYCVEVTRAEGMEAIAEPGRYPNGMPYYQAYRMRGVWSSLTYEILPDASPLLRFVPDPSPPSGEPAQPNPLAGLPDEASLSRFITRWRRPFNRMISIPKTLPKFVLETGDKSAGTDAEGFSTGPVAFEGIGKPEPGEVLHYTWHHVPRDRVPRDRQRNSYGRINRYRFDNFPAYTLMAEPPEEVPIKTANGQKLADIHYTFRFLGKVGLDGSYKGWNHFLRLIERTGTPSPTNPKWIIDYRKLTTDGHADDPPIPAKQVFQSFDFSSLFRLE